MLSQARTTNTGAIYNFCYLVLEFSLHLVELRRPCVIWLLLYIERREQRHVRYRQVCCVSEVTEGTARYYYIKQA